MENSCSNSLDEVLLLQVDTLVYSWVEINSTKFLDTSSITLLNKIHNDLWNQTSNYD